ncbi:MAG: hypothetical protein IKA29_02715, partial [Clostridia bacterium]|nr:hypothetical protein [Clostridia bacterium]
LLRGFLFVFLTSPLRFLTEQCFAIIRVLLNHNNTSLARILLVKPASHSGRGGSRKTDGEGVKRTFLVRKTAFSQGNDRR